MRLFTYLDYLNGACVATEVDTPWQARWSKIDAKNGLCDDQLVGQRKHLPAGDDQEEPEELEGDALVKEECRKAGIDIKDIPAVTQMMFSLWPYTFSKTHGALVRSESDRVVEQQLRAKAASVQLADLTAHKLARMDNDQLWSKVILAVSEETTLEQFSRICLKWGVDSDELIAALEDE